MQHWVLCECLNELRKIYESLHLVTTHSMAPWSVPLANGIGKPCRRGFVRAANRLSELEKPTVYESAWRKNSGPNGMPYPSSILFAKEVWEGQLSCSICEASPVVAEEINGWLGSVNVQESLQHSVLIRGDWRAAASSPEFLRTEASCVYVECDPMRFDNRELSERKSKDPQSLYPEDIEHIGNCLASVNKPLLVQVSSFSTQKNNIPLDVQRGKIVERFSPHGIELRAEARVKMQMGSWVFTRNCEFGASDLGERFATWLEAV